MTETDVFGIRVETSKSGRSVAWRRFSDAAEAERKQLEHEVIVFGGESYVEEIVGLARRGAWISRILTSPSKAGKPPRNLPPIPKGSKAAKQIHKLHGGK